MSAKSKTKMEPVERDQISDAFKRRVDVDDHLRGGYRICEKHHCDPAMAHKKCRLRHQLEHELYTLGGGVTDDEQAIARLVQTIAVTRSRLDGAVEPLLQRTLKASIQSFESTAATLREIVESAGVDAKVNQRTLSAQLGQLEHRLDGLERERQRFDAGRFPVPDELADRIMTTQTDLSATRSEFTAGRKRLEELGPAAQEARVGERLALGTTLLSIIKDLGEKTKAVYDGDLGRYYEFPRSAPAEGDGLFREARDISDLAARLGRAGGIEMFFGACGDVAEHILEVRLGLRALPSWTRPARSTSMSVGEAM